MELPVVDFEGIDGAGKSYALDHLRKHYEEKEIPVVVVSSISVHEFIDAHDPKWYDITNDTTRFATYLTYQLNNYYKNIKPHIRKKVILIDRYIPSCFAYNRLYEDFDPEFQPLVFELINLMLTKFFIPDVTFLFDVDNNYLLERFKLYRKHEKLPDLKFTQAVREGYQLFTQTYDKQWDIKLMDGSKDINIIVQEMLRAIDNCKTGVIL